MKIWDNSYSGPYNYFSPYSPIRPNPKPIKLPLPLTLTLIHSSPSLQPPPPSLPCTAAVLPPERRLQPAPPTAAASTAPASPLHAALLVACAPHGRARPPPSPSPPRRRPLRSSRSPPVRALCVAAGRASPWTAGLRAPRGRVRPWLPAARTLLPWAAGRLDAALLPCGGFSLPGRCLISPSLYLAGEVAAAAAA